MDLQQLTVTQVETEEEQGRENKQVKDEDDPSDPYTDSQSNGEDQEE
jgi:hypothetical protein